MSVLVIRGRKYTLPASCAAPFESRRVCADGTDRQTDGRTPDRYITLSAARGQRYNAGDHSDIVINNFSGEVQQSVSYVCLYVPYF